MRILQAMAGSEFGGAEQYFVRLAIALDRTEVEQRVLIRRFAKRAEMLRTGGVDTMELSFGGRLDWKTRPAFKKQVNEFEPDLILTWMNRATAMCPKSNVPHVARLGGYYDLKYYSDCDHLVANTTDIVDYLVDQGWSQDKAHYLPNFVSGRPGKPLDRKPLFTPGGIPLILALGRLHRNKAFDVLLEALARVPDVYLWIAGEGPERDNLEALAEKLAVKPRVRFLGWRDDIEDLLATCDLFVCPSRLEPLGNVVIEAWAQGVPVVAADSYGPGTLIKHMDSGVLVPIEDATTLRRAIRNVLEDGDLRQHIAGQGRQAYLDSFTEETVVAQYLEFFEKVCG